MLSVTAQWLQSAESHIVYQIHRCNEDFDPQFVSGRSEHPLSACTLHSALLHNMPVHILNPDTHAVMRMVCCNRTPF